MAWTEAQIRIYGEVRTFANPPFSRAWASTRPRSASTEYYRMVDKAANYFEIARDDGFHGGRIVL
jgi:hypothetical protein